jgi:hypothetical protein
LSWKNERYEQKRISTIQGIEIEMWKAIKFRRLLHSTLHKKVIAVFPSPAGMELTKLSLAGTNSVNNNWRSVALLIDTSAGMLVERS